MICYRAVHDNQFCTSDLRRDLICIRFSREVGLMLITPWSSVEPSWEVAASGDGTAAGLVGRLHHWNNARQDCGVAPRSEPLVLLWDEHTWNRTRRSLDRGMCFEADTTMVLIAIYSVTWLWKGTENHHPFSCLPLAGWMLFKTQPSQCN